MKKFFALVASVAVSFSMLGATVSAQGSPEGKPVEVKVQEIVETETVKKLAAEDAVKVQAKASEVVAAVASSKEVKATFAADITAPGKVTLDKDYSGMTADLFHLKKDGEWEVKKDVKIEGNQVMVDFDSFSPVLIVVSEAKVETPKKEEAKKDAPAEKKDTKTYDTKGEPAPAAPVVSEGKPVSPQTNDAAPFVSIMSTVAMLSAAGYVFVSKK